MLVVRSAETGRRAQAIKLECARLQAGGMKYYAAFEKATSDIDTADLAGDRSKRAANMLAIMEPALQASILRLCTQPAKPKRQIKETGDQQEGVAVPPRRHHLLTVRP